MNRTFEHHCKNCGQPIVQGLGPRWVHFHGGLRRCEATTFAEPAAAPTGEEDR